MVARINIGICMAVVTVYRTAVKWLGFWPGSVWLSSRKTEGTEQVLVSNRYLKTGSNVEPTADRTEPFNRTT